MPAKAPTEDTRVPRTRVDQVWGAQGLLGTVIGLVLFSQLGAALGTVRTILAVWVLATAAATAWRWRLDRARSTYLLLAAAIGLVAGVAVLVADGVPALLWIVGLFWVAVGVLQLLAWVSRPNPAVESPWIAAWIVFLGAILITLPYPLVPIVTVLGGLGAVVLGFVHVVRWVGMRRHREQASAPVQARATPRLTASMAVTALLLVVPVLGYGGVFVSSGAENARQAELDSFYRPGADLSAGLPGSIVRIEPLSTPGVDGRGWRVLFRSEDAHGRVTVSSGAVYAPASPGSNRLVVAWAHGTVGLAPNCAPSRQAVDSAISPWLNQMLDRGWVVTAPDYAGAGGTGGPGATEMYLIGAEQGRDLLNGVRAAQHIAEAGAGSRFAIYGHSQGGLVALFGAALASTYAPDLSLVAVGVVSAASDIGGILHEQWNSPLVGWLLGPMVIYPWTRQYPALDANAILTQAGLNHYQEMATSTCITDLVPAVINPLMGDFLSSDPTANPAWRQAFLENQAPLVPARLPVFIGHGLTDPLIDPAFSAWLVTRYCAQGTPVATDWLPGVGHADAAIQAASRYIEWLANIVGGLPPASDCGKSMPVTPARPISS